MRQPWGKAPTGVAGSARMGGRRVFAQQIAPQGALPPVQMKDEFWEINDVLKLCFS